jgi:hypothetical protein
MRKDEEKKYKFVLFLLFNNHIEYDEIVSICGVD